MRAYRGRRPRCHGVMVYLICAVIGLGGRGEIIHGLKRLPKVPLHTDVRSYLSGSSVIQRLAAREEIGTVVYIYIYIYIFIYIINEKNIACFGLK